jgi:hypothetical protein
MSEHRAGESKEETLLPSPVRERSAGAVLVRKIRCGSMPSCLAAAAVALRRAQVTESSNDGSHLQ